MTVAEVIERLKKYPSDMKVVALTDIIGDGNWESYHEDAIVCEGWLSDNGMLYKEPIDYDEFDPGEIIERMDFSKMEKVVVFGVMP